MKTALLLIAHGSRNVEANDDLVALAMALREEYAIVEPAFLELAEPTIAVAGRRCVEQGATRVILMPYFLSAGVHVRQDLATWRAQLAQEYEQVEWLLAEPIGRHPLVRTIVLERAGAASEPRAAD